MHCRAVWTVTRWNALPCWILSAKATTCSLRLLRYWQKLSGYRTGIRGLQGRHASPVRKCLQTDGYSENSQKQRDNRDLAEENRKNAAPHSGQHLSGSTGRQGARAPHGNHRRQARTQVYHCYITATRAGLVRRYRRHYSGRRYTRPYCPHSTSHNTYRRKCP